MIFYFNRGDLVVECIRAILAGKVVTEVIKRERSVRQPCFGFLDSDQIVFVTKRFCCTGNRSLIQIQV